MGNNQLYTIYERLVIQAYDAGRCGPTREDAQSALRPLLEIGRGTDIDHGGCHDLETKDGKGADEVVLEAWGITLPPKPMADATDAAHEAYSEAFFTAFNDLTSREFGWE